MSLGCPHTTDVGVYLLGAMTATEHDGFSRHVAGCTFCSTEVDKLEPVARRLIAAGRFLRAAQKHPTAPTDPGQGPGPGEPRS